MRNTNTYECIGEILQPESLSDAFHGEMYRAICHLIEKGHLADPITLNKYLAEHLTKDNAGGSVKNFILNLAENVVLIVNAEEYARVMKSFKAININTMQGTSLIRHTIDHCSIELGCIIICPNTRIIRWGTNI